MTRERHFASPSPKLAASAARIWQSVLEAFSRLAQNPLASRRLSVPPVQHLDETQLLAYLDGELPKIARRHAADHLQSCWSCRSRYRELCAMVKAYVVRREIELPDSDSESDRRVRQLRQRLVGSSPSLPRP